MLWFLECLVEFSSTRRTKKEKKKKIKFSSLYYTQSYLAKKEFMFYYEQTI